MSNPKLSQTAIFEILVSEVESIKNTKGEFNKILTQINAHLIRLEELYKQPIPVDIEAMRQEHERIQSTLARGLYFPKWLVITFLCFVVLFSISIGLNYKQYFTNQEQAELIEQAKEYIQELRGQLAKPKGKR
jgi:predicted transcriptional regulator